MNITHELMAQVFQHAASLHTELAHIHQDNARLVQENVRLSKQVHDTEHQGANSNGHASLPAEDNSEVTAARHAAIARRLPL